MNYGRRDWGAVMRPKRPHENRPPVMDLERKRKAIAEKQKYMDSLSHAPIIPYPYCCLCFERLTEHNIYSDSDDRIWDECLKCKDK